MLKETFKKTLALISCLFIVSCTNLSTSSSTSSSITYSKEYKVFDGLVKNLKNSENQVVTPFNTQVTFRAYNEHDYHTIFPVFQDRMHSLHKQFDRYNYYLEEGKIINNLRVINESYGSGQAIEISDELYNLLEMSINLSELTKGYFNPTLGELSDTWTYEIKEGGIKSQRFSPYCLKGNDPSINDIQDAMESIVPYESLRNVIELNKDESTVKFNKYNNIDKVTLSLGAIAKGFAVELAKKELESYNTVLSISGGTSSSYTIGKNPNPERDYWLIGLASPYKSGFDPTAMLSVKFNNTYTLSVSGDYESSYYIEENGKKIIRHHILNPFTGYPENNVRVLSVWSDTESGVLDGLSTALFNMPNSEEMLDTIYRVEEFYNMDIEVFYEVEVNQEKKKIDLYMTKDFKDIVYQYNTAYFNGVSVIDDINEGLEK